MRLLVVEDESLLRQQLEQGLTKQGYVVGTEELISAVDASGFASSVDSVNIVPKSELPAGMAQDTQDTVDVAAIAGDQAMADINAELPQ